MVTGCVWGPSVKGDKQVYLEGRYESNTVVRTKCVWRLTCCVYFRARHLSLRCVLRWTEELGGDVPGLQTLKTAVSESWLRHVHWWVLGSLTEILCQAIVTSTMVIVRKGR